jgi:hypothetical protein
MRRGGLGKLLACVSALVAAVLCACVSTTPVTSSEDAAGFTFPDAGFEDAGLEDSAIPDAADAARPDVGPPDTGAFDAGPSCGTNNGGCPTNSTCSIDAGIVCTCNPGFSGAACASNCGTNNGGCDPNAACANGAGGVTCTCNAGYSGSGTTCASNCGTSNGGCDPNATCANGDAGVVCTCNAGYSGSGTTCASNCGTSNGGCDPNAACANGDAGVVCTCNAGSSGSGTTCASDCSTNNGGCDPNANCSNGDAGVSCACLAGYTGNGTTCTSDCLTSNGGCDPNATCSNSVSGVVCTCNAGYAGNGTTCTTDCLTNNGGCDPNATCSNGDAGVACTCNVGYAGNGTTCASDCLTNNGGCDPHATCSLGDAGVLCACNVGYNGSGTVCASDCLTANGGCDPNATCSNGGEGGAIACACNLGFTGNGITCTSNDYMNWPVPPVTPADAQFSVSADGTIAIDSATGLVWQRFLLPNPCPLDADGGVGCTWPDSQTYCQSLNGIALGGISSGWRVPSLVELLSLASYAGMTPTIDTSIFPGTPLASFWTNTTDSLDTAQAWGLSFNTALNATAPLGTPMPVRCVTSVSPPVPLPPPTCGASPGQACCYANACGPNLLCNGTTCQIDVNYVQTPVDPDVPAQASSTVSADGVVVVDPAAGLVWQRVLLPNPCPADEDGGVGGCTWRDAQSYCASLNTTPAGGLEGIAGGWRLPSLQELLSIVNYGVGVPMLDTALFPNTPIASFWVSTPDSLNGADAWTISFANGLNTVQATATSNYVRCVSAVPPSPTFSPACGAAVGDACCYANSCGPGLACNGTTCVTDLNYTQGPAAVDVPAQASSTVSADGTVVLDSETGLVWQRELVATACGAGPDGGAGCNWQGAAAYCASLNTTPSGGLAGISGGWRLPSLWELLSLVNYAVGVPMIDTALYPGTPLASFWVSTPNAANSSQAWTLSFDTGLNNTEATSTPYWVRCVSSVQPPVTTPSCGAAVGDPCCYGESCGPGLTCNGSSLCVTDLTYTQGTPAPVVPAEVASTVSSNGVIVTDSATGLIWQRELVLNACASEEDGGSGCSWQGAQDYCASLNSSPAGGLQGSTGWRLPALWELLSLVNYGVGTPMIDVALYPGTPLASFWVQTTDSLHSGNAWTLSFANGLNTSEVVATPNYVRCVSSTAPSGTLPSCGAAPGQACCYANSCGPDLSCNADVCAFDLNYTQFPPEADVPAEAASTVSPDGSIVMDTATGLIWQRNLVPSGCDNGSGVCTLQAAQTYCASLDTVGSGLGLGGIASGWRVPALNELLSIVNYGVLTPFVDPALYPSTPLSPGFWTQTPSGSDPTKAWTISFGNGLNTLQSTSVGAAVRCVSSLGPTASPSCGLKGETCCYASGCGPNLACTAAGKCDLAPDYAQWSLPGESQPEGEYVVSPGGSTVTDTATGLVWQRPLAANPCGASDAGAGCTWAGATAYCESLDTAVPGGLGGYGAGWRLPSLVELLSIVDYANGVPLIQEANFPSTPAVSFWTQTADGSDATRAWSVSFGDGLNTTQLTSVGSEVRCVNSSGVLPAAEGCGALGQSCCYAEGCGVALTCASGTCIVNDDYVQWPVPSDAPPVPANQYTLGTTGELVYDSVTSLTWALSPGGTTPCGADGAGVCTWADAGALCASLTTGNLSFRLPTLMELTSIVDYAVVSGPMIDTAAFPGVMATQYWSSTVGGAAPGQAWTMSFANGLNALQSTTAVYAPLCVH